MHHSSCWAATFHLRLSWFNILISPVWCHKVDACVRACMCVRVSLLITDSDGRKRWETEKLEMKKRPNTGKTIWLWSLMDAPRAFFSLSAFFFPLLIFLPPEPPSISPNSLMASISEGVFACARMHSRCFQMWFIRSEQQLVLMCGGLLVIGFFLTQAGDWCWWWPPCCFHSSLNQAGTSQKHMYVLHLWKKLKNKTHTFGTSLLMMFYHKPLLRQTK